MSKNFLEIRNSVSNIEEALDELEYIYDIMNTDEDDGVHDIHRERIDRLHYIVQMTDDVKQRAISELAYLLKAKKP